MASLRILLLAFENQLLQIQRTLFKKQTPLVWHPAVKTENKAEECVNKTKTKRGLMLVPCILKQENVT